MASHYSNVNPLNVTVYLFFSRTDAGNFFNCNYLLINVPSFAQLPLTIKNINLNFNNLFLYPADLKMTSNATHNLFLAPVSSYESLDKFNCTSETLKITDDYHQQKNNLINTMNQIPIPSCEIISTTEMEHKTSSPIKHQIHSMNNNHRLMSNVGDEAKDLDGRNYVDYNFF